MIECFPCGQCIIMTGKYRPSVHFSERFNCERYRLEIILGVIDVFGVERPGAAGATLDISRSRERSYRIPVEGVPE